MNIARLFESIENANSLKDLQAIILEYKWEMEVEKLNKQYPALPFELRSE